MKIASQTETEPMGAVYATASTVPADGSCTHCLIQTRYRAVITFEPVALELHPPRASA